MKEFSNRMYVVCFVYALMSAVAVAFDAMYAGAALVGATISTYAVAYSAGKASKQQ